MATDGSALTGKVAADFTSLWYRRDALTVAISPSDLANLNSAFSAGGIKEEADGWYRLDVPDAAFASGAKRVAIGGAVGGGVLLSAPITLGTLRDTGVRLGQFRHGGPGATLSLDNYIIKRRAASNWQSIATDAVGSNDLTLTGFSTPADAWSTDIPDGSYSTTLDNSGTLAAASDGTMTNYTDVDAAHVADVPTGRTGHSIKFRLNGTTEHVACAELATLNSASAFTLATWFKQPALDVTCTMFMKYLASTAYLSVDISASGYVYTRINNGSSAYGMFDYDGVVTAGTWHHFAIVYDGTQTGNVNRLKVYIDGVSQTLDFGATTIPATTAALAGRTFYLGNTTSTWAGSLYDFRVYSTALSAANVLLVKSNTYTATDPTFKMAAGLDTTRTIPSCADGCSILLNGTTDYLTRSVADFRLADAGGLISLWWKGTDTGGTLFSSSDTGTATSFFKIVTTATGLSIQQQDAAGTLDSVPYACTILDGAWHNIVVATTGSGWLVYVDGVSKSAGTPDSGADSGHWFSSTTLRDNISVGLHVDNVPDTYLAGRVDDVRIYSGTWTAGTAAAAAVALFAGYEVTDASPVAHWPLDPDLISAGAYFASTIGSAIQAEGTVTGLSSHSAADIVTAVEADGSKLDHLWETTEDYVGTRRFTALAMGQVILRDWTAVTETIPERCVLNALRPMFGVSDNGAGVFSIPNETGGVAWTMAYTEDATLDPVKTATHA